MSHLISAEKLKLAVRVTTLLFSLDFAGVNVQSLNPGLYQLVKDTASIIWLTNDELKSAVEVLEDLVVVTQVRLLSSVEVQNILRNQLAEMRRVMEKFKQDVDDYFREAGEPQGGRI